jgi:hypothetical protein
VGGDGAALVPSTRASLARVDSVILGQPKPYENAKRAKKRARDQERAETGNGDPAQCETHREGRERHELDEPGGNYNHALQVPRSN